MSGQPSSFLSQLFDAVKRNPRRAILAVAVISVLVSCYPVVFFGRSFVSANAVPMLYPGIPSLPGHDETETENFKGSDAGAIMWHDVPNSFIQSRALFRDGELPLWNRYNSCGLTLLGQGQSMFGDPLHMLPVLASGEAWAWDLKFLLAKVLFCFGLGLAVYASSRHLPTALLLAFSAGFIGFFAQCFNHPAFFSVCYAPWLLACWLEITRAATLRSAVGWIAGLLLASWAELNSGTAKGSLHATPESSRLRVPGFPADADSISDKKASPSRHWWRCALAHRNAGLAYLFRGAAKGLCALQGSGPCLSDPAGSAHRLVRRHLLPSL
jgi:hypothetical protein